MIYSPLNTKNMYKNMKVIDLIISAQFHVIQAKNKVKHVKINKRILKIIYSCLGNYGGYSQSRINNIQVPEGDAVMGTAEP